MNSKIRSASILVSLFLTMMVSTAQAQQALPDKSVKQINSIDAAVHSNRSYNLLIKIQSQVNALSADSSSAQVAEIKANLKSLTDDMVNALSMLDTDVQAIQDQNTKIEVGVSNTNSTLQGVGAELVKIDQQQFVALSVAQSNELARRTDDIEGPLVSGKFELSDYTPGPSGKLDRIRDFVSAKASEAESNGWRDQEYKHYLTIANADYANQNYHGALSNYHKAYKHLVGKVSHSFAPKSWFVSTFH